MGPVCRSIQFLTPRRQTFAPVLRHGRGTFGAHPVFLGSRCNCCGPTGLAARLTTVV